MVPQSHGAALKLGDPIDGITQRAKISIGDLFDGLSLRSALKKNKPASDTEYMLVAFHNDCCYTVVYACGGCVENDISEVDCIGLVLNESENAPDHGIWVWEGIPKAIGGGADFEGFDYNNSGWRKPIAEEWACIMDNRNPWK